MTTLAWDGRILATDSGCMNGETRIPWGAQKLWVYPATCRYRAYCGSGDLQDVKRVADYFGRERQPCALDETANGPRVSSGFAGLVVIGTRCYDIESEFIEAEIPQGRYYARGSGRELALGAMFMGGGAIDAVRAAIHWMASHAAPIQWFDATTGEQGETD